MRRIYAARQGHLVAALRQRLSDHVAFEVPRGGLALWVRALRTDPEAWSERAMAAGVAFEAGRSMHLGHTPLPYFRCGFAPLDLAELTRAVDILAATA